MRSTIPLLLAALFLAAGCAPTVTVMGPPVTEAMLADDHILTTDAARLPLRIWKPAGTPTAALVALHGFNDYSKSFEDPGEFWAEKGLVTYAYDQRGFGEAPDHGLWAGTETLVEDLRVAVRLIRERHPGIPVYLVGESMGGAIILTALGTDNPPIVNGVVLAAPAVRGWRAIPWYQRAALGLVAHTVPWVTATGRGFKVRPSDNIEMLRGLGRDPLVIKATRFDSIYGLVTVMDEALEAAPRLSVPALVMYGKIEDLVPRKGREVLLGALPADGDWRLAEYSKGYHMLLRDLNAAIVLTDIVAWSTDPTAPLPSGEERPDRKLGPPPRKD
ncbi:MAG: lysophospholipase [Alphaproteobacteria bacterium]|nr:lysophospholipase [Alphaproteobacteria bacterium]